LSESADGVDLTLIRWTLSLTPLQRLEVLQDWVDGLAELRHGRIAERQPVAMLPVLRQTLAMKTRAERDRRD
jgi:hypothetical protein